MDKRELELILSDQREELRAKKRQHLCPRCEQDMIDMDSPQAQVVIGLRRSGKSTLCFLALEKSGVSYAYVNFDDERLAKIKSESLNDVLEVLYKIYGDFTHLFIDEIQNIPEWYLFVNRLLRTGMRIVITGSNAKLLSGELATHLTGRSHKIELYTFSFREYCSVRDVNIEDITTKAIALRRAAFDDYMREGGFPELITLRDKRVYVADLVDNILKRDIELRYRIQHKASLEQVAQYLLDIAPAIVSDSGIQETFGIRSLQTVKNYVSYLRQAYLLIGLHKYSPKSRIRITGEKLYPADVSFMSARPDAFSGANLGWRLETVVFLELLRTYRPQGYDVYYYSERSSECDFILCRGRQAETAIQVSYDISNPRTLKREISGLLHASAVTGCKRLFLLTDHEHADRTIDGHTVAIRPVYDWLLTHGA